MSPRETVGSALENTQEVLSAENWGLGFGAEGTQPTGTAAAEKLKEYNAYYVGAAEEKRSISLLIVVMRTVIALLYWMH